MDEVERGGEAQRARPFAVGEGLAPRSTADGAGDGTDCSVGADPRISLSITALESADACEPLSCAVLAKLENAFSIDPRSICTPAIPGHLSTNG